MKDKNYFKKLASQLMFELSDVEAQEVLERFKTFEAQLSHLEAVDTEGIEPMIFPFDTPTSYLRADEVSGVLEQSEVLQNAPKVKEGHFVVPKVVK